MNIHDAVMKAADHIERNPHLFEFDMNPVPHDCGTPGCALGWVGYFMRTGECAADVACVMSLPSEPWAECVWGWQPNDHTPEFAFYNRMTDISGGTKWTRDPIICASTLRLYAAKYLTPAKPAQTLDWNALAERLGREPLLVSSESTALRAAAR